MTEPASDPFQLQRFIDAQAGVYATALAELKAGRKETHWMWYIFPQVLGLGSSPRAVTYAIRSLAEGRAYVAHPVLGPRLRECTSTVIRLADRTLDQIFGYPDSLKFHSSMTLFTRAAPEDTLFNEALSKYCDGRLDLDTLSRLRPY